MHQLTRRLPSLTGALLAATLAGCASSKPAPPAKSPMTLELEATASATREKLPPEALEKIERANRELIESGIAETALRVGEKAPTFTLPDGKGNLVSLDGLLAQGPVVLTFYRGHW